MEAGQSREHQGCINGSITVKIFKTFMSIKLKFVVSVLIACILNSAELMAEQKLLYWDFEDNNNRTTLETATNVRDTLEGNFEEAPGVIGKGIRLDGFTTRLIKQPGNVEWPSDRFTVEAWVALGNYPWNWCPLITTESEEVKGWRLMIGPHGQISLQIAINEQWLTCSSAQTILPLRTWKYIAGVYKANHEINLYLDGKLIATVPIQGKVTYPDQPVCKIGMLAYPEKPSDIHRTWGTVASYFGIDGIIDEIKIYDNILNGQEISDTYKSLNINKPDIPERRLPSIEQHPGKFGAFYTKLKYYPGWDNLWPVEQDPDIVVCFEKSPVKLIFWRGIRYGASWVSENENWMTDQSVEAWDDDGKDRQGCFEHMQDRHCRFSHVRIIENTDARVVIHWRYAPVSAHDNTWRPDPKTGWECWIDEYYYIYPDASAIRRVSWKKGSLGYPRQFQESLALLHPGQVISELLEKDFTFVADYENNTGKGLFVEDPNSPPYGPFTWDKTYPYTIQRYNFKSVNKPFICFEPENKMYIRHNSLNSYDKAGGCNHFPVGQARCDGRTTRTADRPSHCSSFPISDPLIHAEGDRYYWSGLYGMNNMTVDQLVKFGRSWAFAPEMTDLSAGYKSEGYDRSRRCYKISKDDKVANSMSFNLNGSADYPLINPAVLIKNWNAENAKIVVDGKTYKNCETAVKQELGGKDLIIFLWLKSDRKVKIEIIL